MSHLFRSSVAGLAAALVVSLVAASPARAETRYLKDPYNGSTPGLNLQRGTFSYTDDAATFRLKVESLRKAETMLVAKYLRRGDETLTVATKFVDGRKRVTVHYSDAQNYRRVSNPSVTATWDFASDVVVIRIGSRHLQGQRATLYAWTQRKTAMHGLPGGRDDLVAEGMRRG